MTSQDRLSLSIRARCGAVWVATQEERRVELAATALAQALKFAEVLRWTVTGGLQDLQGAPVSPGSEDLSAALAAFLERPGRSLLLACDTAPWLADPIQSRALRDAHRKLPSTPKTGQKDLICIETGPPPETVPGLYRLEWELPDRQVMERLLDNCLDWAGDKAREDLSQNGTREAVVGAMIGLDSEAAQNALARSLAESGVFQPSRIAAEKAEVVKGSGLEWYDPGRSLDDVGGMGGLTPWLGQRRKAFGQAAREFGLPEPRGLLLTGIPGCGKSLLAKATAAAWQMPLLRLDVGAMFSKFVGESEGQLRRALATAEAVAPCVLWLDEIEKAFASQGGETDGGTTSRVFGGFLTWMQERKSGVFVFATANDVAKLPPEMLRAGRWDDLFFVDLPSHEERREICEVMSRRYPQAAGVSAEVVAGACEGHTGAEIEQSYIDALYRAFESGPRPVETQDLVEACASRVPLIETMREKLDELRTWARSRAKLANSPETAPKPAGQADLFRREI